MKKLGLLLVTSTLLSSCSDSLWGCGRDITNVDFSPSKEKAIISVNHNCGAASSPTFLKYLVESNVVSEVSNDPYKLGKKWMFLKAEKGTITTKWKSNFEVEVSYSSRVEFFKQKSKIGDVKIDYD